MLVMNVKVGQQIHIGNDIIVRVVEIDGSRVKLATIAPREVSIVREELLKKGTSRAQTNPR